MAAEPVPAPAQRRGRLPRWACQTSLFQLREPAFWVYVLLLVGTGLQAVGQQQSLRAMSPSGWVLSWLLLLLYLVPVFVVVYLLDAYEREPLSLVFGALLWGAVAATSLAGLANHDRGCGGRPAPRARRRVPLDARPDRPVGRGDPQSPRGGAHLPDRPVGDQRRRGRVCLRGDGRAGVRRGRERLLLRRAVRRPTSRRRRRLLRPRPGQRAVRPRALHRPDRDGDCLVRHPHRPAPGQAPAGRRWAMPVGRAGSLPVELAVAQPAPDRGGHPGRAAGCCPAGRRRQGCALPRLGGPAGHPGP